MVVVYFRELKYFLITPIHIIHFKVNQNQNLGQTLLVSILWM